MTQKLDDKTSQTVDRVRAHPIFERIRERKFDRAWDAIKSDRQLDAARAKLSLHELRLIVQHTADAFET